MINAILAWSTVFFICFIFAGGFSMIQGLANPNAAGYPTYKLIGGAYRLVPSNNYESFADFLEVFIFLAPASWFAIDYCQDHGVINVKGEQRNYD